MKRSTWSSCSRSAPTTTSPSRIDCANSSRAFAPCCVVARPTRASRTSDDEIKLGPIRMDIDARRCYVDGEEIKLRKKEFALLRLLLENPGRVLTREVLIDRIWGSDYVGDTKTLDVHIKRLRTLIEDKPEEPRTHHDRARRRLPLRGYEAFGLIVREFAHVGREHLGQHAPSRRPGDTSRSARPRYAPSPSADPFTVCTSAVEPSLVR